MDKGDEEYDSVGNREEQEEEDEDVRDEVDEVGGGHCEGEDADDDDEDGEEEKSSCAGGTAVDLVEVTDDVSNVGVSSEVRGGRTPPLTYAKTAVAPSYA